MSDTEYMKIPEAAELLRHKPQTVEKLCRERRLPAIKLPGTKRWLIRRQDLQDYLDSLLYEQEEVTQ